MKLDRRVAFIVPRDVDDPAHPTGGNVYDRHLMAALAQAGWSVDVRATVSDPSTDGGSAVAHAMASLPAGLVVVVDGLLAATATRVLVAQAARLRLILLMHMSMAVPPPGHDRPGAAAAERSVLGVAAGVIVTSEWLRHQLVVRHRLDPDLVSVAAPGVERAPVAVPSPAGSRLLCVAPVAPHKGHDVLVDALGRLSALAWTCRCAGSLAVDVDFATITRADVEERGIADRLVFVGVRTRSELGGDYATSDLLVLPTRSESYGMVLTEALARGLPVVVSNVGGVVEAATGGTRAGPSDGFPGALVSSEDADALAETLRIWLTDPGTRAAWRRRAAHRRLHLRGWDFTAQCAVRAIERASSLGLR